MAERGVLVTRDKSEIRYRDSIQQFMRRIGAGKCVIVILEKAYLESKNCMYELTQIASRPEFAPRVYPIVMPDAGDLRPHHQNRVRQVLGGQARQTRPGDESDRPGASRGHPG